MAKKKHATGPEPTPTGDLTSQEGLMGHSARSKDLKWQALDYIRRHIFNGEFQPGTLISALGIAKRLSNETGKRWSRSPVREAMEVLSNEGLILWKGIAGAEVQVINGSALFDALVLRYGIETQVAQRLGRLHHPRKLSALREELRAMEAFIAKVKPGAKLPSGITSEWDKNRWEWYELDKHFHLKMAELSGIRRAEVYIANLLDTFLLYASQNPGMPGDVLKEHEAIVEAIEKFDPSEPAESHKRIRGAIKAHMIGTAGRWAIDITASVKELD